MHSRIIRPGPATGDGIDEVSWEYATEISQRVCGALCDGGRDHRLFQVEYTPRGISCLLHRLGWSPQVPVVRAVERDEQAVATWRKERSTVKGRPRSSGPG